MAQKENKQKKAMVFIPVDPMNPYEEVVTVSINGYCWNIARGAMVEVPLEVAEILKTSKNISDYKVIE